MAARPTKQSGSTDSGFTLEDTDNGEQQPINPGDFGSGGNGDGGSIRDAAGTEFDPSIHIDPDRRNSDGSFRRKRGRKAGSGNKSKAKVYRNLDGSIEALSRGLAIFHAALASATKTPEIAIGDDEAKSLASASIHVMELYDIRPDPKIEAIIGLIGVSAAIYAPRVVAIRMRKEQERQERRTTKDSGNAGLYDEFGNPLGTTGYQEWPVAN